MLYDRADWHYGGDFPVGLPPENGATHIGMFLAWAIINRLEGELHKQESPDVLDDVRARRSTGRQFLLECCDEKLNDESLNDEGNAFARSYYEGGAYLSDYEKTLGAGVSDLYEVEDTWENYEKIAGVIDARFAAWKGKAARPWWRFWRQS
jgi:hypothetical protein